VSKWSEKSCITVGFIHMDRLDLDCFDDLDALFAEHEGKVLNQNETVLGQVKETILSASTHLLSNPSGDRQT
jgi:hypothetical protein